MRTLAERLQHALSQKKDATQADLARYCKTKGPSVSDWFRGETKSLKAQSLVLAAEFLEVRSRWLLDGHGPMRHGDAGGALLIKEPPALWDALPVVLDAIAAPRSPETLAELRGLLPLLVGSSVADYRKRLAALLTSAPPAGPHTRGFARFMQDATQPLEEPADPAPSIPTPPPSPAPGSTTPRTSAPRKSGKRKT